MVGGKAIGGLQKTFQAGIAFKKKFWQILKTKIGLETIVQDNGGVML